MNCNCRWTEFILALVVLVFVIWPTQIFSATVSWWLVLVAAVLLLIHSIFHHRCGCEMCSSGMSKSSGMSRSSGVRRSRRKRR